MLKTTSVFTIALCLFSQLQAQNPTNKTTNPNEQNQEVMVMLPSFTQLPEINQDIQNTEGEAIATKKYMVVQDGTDPKILKAGDYLKKGGNQLLAGTVVSLVATAVGILIINAGASTTTTSYSSSSSTTTTSSGAIAAGGLIIVAGSVTSIVLNISGAVNIARAGKALKSEY